MHAPNITIDFELDNTFNSFIRKFKLSLIFLRFPEAKQILNDFREIKSYSRTSIRGNRDFFTIRIDTGIGKDYYYMVWDIEKVKKYLYANPKQVFQIPLKVLHRSQEDLNLYKLDKLKYELPRYKFPIVLIDHVIENIVIDGNHRCHLYALNDICNIRGIRLDMQETYQFIFSPQHKKIFAFHYNLASILSLRLFSKENLIMLINDKFVIAKKRRIAFFW